MRKRLILIGLLTMLALVACGGTAVTTEPSAANTTTSADTNQPSAALNLDADDLSPQAQLALGLIQLDTTDSALTLEQAEEMLPFWRALQSLVDSGTAADVEVEAVVNQLQGMLTDTQVAQLNGMEFSAEAIQEMMAQTREAAGTGRGAAAGGGFAGGVPGGGGGPGGGPGGNFGGGVDPNQLATRQAEAGGEGGAAGLQDQMLINSVVRLLEAKTGDVTIMVTPFGAITAVADATGLTTEEIRTLLDEDQTLADIVTANGADLDAVRAALAEQFADATLAEGQTLESAIEEVLTTAVEMRQGPQPTGE